MPTGGGAAPQLVPRADGLSPAWLADYGLEGQELTTELLEQQVLPQVRNHVGTERQQLLATMVLLGMNRVAVQDGSISAKVMFRAGAPDVAKVGYATGSDPKAVANWGERGSDDLRRRDDDGVDGGRQCAERTNLRADLFGEVKLNFVSETLPLDKLAEPAKVPGATQFTRSARPRRRLHQRRRRDRRGTGRRMKEARDAARTLATVLDELHGGLVRRHRRKAGVQVTRVEMTLPMEVRLVLRGGGCALLADVPRSRARRMDGSAVDGSRLSIRWEAVDAQEIAS